MQNRVFVLGVGAQKAGTTWLHHYLSQQDCSDFGFRKEYHVFDASTGAQQGFYRRASKSAIAALSRKEPGEKGANAIRRMDFILNNDSYFDYFSGLLLEPSIFLTGDITPSYALLDAEIFSMILENMDKRGIKVRPIFLMRDPVYRLQSMVRMSLRNGNERVTKDDELVRMKNFIRRPGAIGRGSYANTIRNLYSAFGKEGVYLDLYETMFTKDLQVRLSSVLGINLGSPPLEESKNVSRTSNSLTEDEYNYFKRQMEDVYASVADLTDLEILKNWRFNP